jgi:hypothetical protein
MVLDFKVNRRLVVGTTINFFCAYMIALPVEGRFFYTLPAGWFSIRLAMFWWGGYCIMRQLVVA